MRTVTTALFAAFVGLAVPGAHTARAQGDLLLHWDNCQSTTELKTFSGAKTYRLILTLQNFGEPNRGQEIVLGFFFPDNLTCYSSAVPDAWRFDPAGCQVGLFTAAPLSSDAACPAMGATSQSASYYSYEVEDGRGILRMGVSYDLTTPDPNKIYTLWRIDFDHGSSTTGPSTDGLCGGAERKACVYLKSGGWFNSDYQGVGFFTGETIAWQEDCAFCDPAHAATWGALKSLYR